MMPIFHHDSPYHTPLSLPAWHIVTGISFVTFWVLQWVTEVLKISDSAYVRFWNLKNNFRKFLTQGMQKMAEETALESPSEIDIRTFMWTFDRLDEDHELERFFAGLPGLRSSRFVNYPLPSLTHEKRWELTQALTGLLDRTFTSDLLPAPVKNRRAIICAKAVDPAYFPHSFSVFDNILSKCQYGGPLATGIVDIVKGWPISTDEGTILYAQAILSMIVAKVQPRDGSWFILASNELGVPETVLRDYAVHGDSLSLAILIHVVHQQLTHYRKWTWPRYEFWKVLEAASKFNGQDTSPTLQHKFCTLWNQIVLEVKNDNDQEMAGFILRLIRHVHIALHQDTDSPPTRSPPFTDGRDDIIEEPSSYTVCNAVGHIHDSTSTAFPRTVLPDNASLVSTSLTSLDALSSSMTAPLHVVKSLMDVPPLDNFHPARQTTIECPGIPVALPDPAIACERRDILNSGIIVPGPTLETATSAPPLSSISPPAAIAAALRHNPDLLMPSNAPTPLSPASSNPVLDNILRTGPSMSSHFPITRPDLSPSCPESHRSIIVTTTPSPSPGSTPAPDLGVAAEELGTLFAQRKGRS